MRIPREHIIYNSMMEYLKQNIAKSHLIKVSQISEALRISPNHLHRICKKISGYSVKKLIADHYTGKAIDFYYNQSMEEKVISDMLGFSEISAFCHFFKRHTGKNLTTFYSEDDI